MLLTILAIFKKSCLFLFERQGYRERETTSECAIFYPLVHSLNGPNDQSWADPKLEPGTSSGTTPQVQGPKHWSILHINRELDLNWSSQDLNYGILAPQPAMVAPTLSV